jgi:hypothetical protein
MDISAWQLIIGTISGFLIAFFAEPVKIHFTSKANIRATRLALYREIISNYQLLRSTRDSTNAIQGQEGNINVGTSLIKYSMRRECYDHLLKEDPSALYQLEDALVINRLYAQIMAIADFVKGKDFVSLSFITFAIDQIGRPIALGELKASVVKQVSPSVAKELEQTIDRHISVALTERTDWQLRLSEYHPETQGKSIEMDLSKVIGRIRRADSPILELQSMSADEIASRVIIVEIKEDK